VSVPLPWLDGFQADKAAAAPGDKRFLAFFVPNGKHMPYWTPTTDGPDYERSTTLAPLASLKHKLLVLTGLRNASAMRRPGGDHARGTGTFLTCHSIGTPDEINGGREPNGVSIDQLIAEQVGTTTRLKSLQLGVTNCCGDQLYSSEFVQNISYDAAGRFLPKTIRVDEAFDQIFAGANLDLSDEEAMRRRALRTSVLDYVVDQAAALKPRLGRSDQQKLDQFQSSARELEQRIQAAGLSTAGCAEVTNPGHDEQSVPNQIAAMLDLIVLAFQCDVTRVVSYMMGSGGDGALTFPFLGIPDQHHSFAHHQGSEDAFRKIRAVDLWEIEQLAYLLGRLDAVDEGATTLLDNTLVFYSSEISDGNRHNHDNLPVLVAGGGTAFATGRHVTYADAPIDDLFISIAHAMGVTLERFGQEGTGPLSGLV
jgi:hypothetical protein